MSGRHGKDGDEETVEEVRAQRDQLAAQLVAALAQLDRIGMSAGFAVTADGTGPLPVVPGQRQPATHRTPKAQRWLRVVPVILLLAAGVRAALKWAAHHAAVTAAAVTGGGGLVIATAALVTAPAHSTPNHAGLTASSLGPAWHTTGIPYPAPAAQRPRAGLDAKSSRKRIAPLLAPVLVPTATVPPSPAASPSPSPSPPPPLLTVPSSPVDLGVYVTGSFTISNPQDQAVSWSADCGADVTPLPAFGVLMPGQQGYQVTVQVNPVDGASGAVCVFSPGNERVSIMWAGAGAPSAGL